MTESLQPTTIIFCVFNNFELACRSLTSIFNNTNIIHEILVIDDASTEGNFIDSLKVSQRSRIRLIRNQQNLGLTKSLNLAIQNRKRRNGVIIVNSDVIVGPKWVESLLEDASSSSLVATVTAPTNNGTIATIENVEIDDIEISVGRINETLYELPKLNPIQIPVPVGHCFYLAEVGINLSAGFDEYFSPGYGEEVDLGIRLSKLGFHHLLSSRTFVYHFGSATFGKSNTIKVAHDTAIEIKYPGHNWEIRKSIDRQDDFLTLTSRVRSALSQLKLLVDTRALSGGRTGTFEVIQGFLSSDLIGKFKSVSLLVRDKYSVNSLSSNFDMIEEGNIENYIRTAGKFDVVFIPSQVTNLANLMSLFNLAHKVSIMQLDYIAADNTTYFVNSDAFSDYRDTATLTLQLADSIFFNSSFVFHESLRFAHRNIRECDLIHTGNGIEKYSDCEVAASPLANRKNRIISIGTSFSHKNRHYGLRIYLKLLETFPDLEFLLVGPHPNFGSSMNEESQFLESLGIAAHKVKIIPWLEDSKLKEMILDSKLVLLTSTSEGFGLIPGESSRLGTPCVFPMRTSFAYVYPKAPFSIMLENLDFDVQQVKELFIEKNALAQVRYLREIADANRWSLIASKIIKNLELTATCPSYASSILKMKIKDGLRRSRLDQYQLLRTVFPPDTFRRRFAIYIYRILRRG